MNVRRDGPKCYHPETSEYFGMVWRDVNGDYKAETPGGWARDFITEESAETWLRDRQAGSKAA